MNTHVTAALIMLCGIVSVAGCLGLARCHPRPKYQERWAIVALTPWFVVVCVAVLGIR